MNARERKCIKLVWDYYHTHGRHDLPWRKTKNPYRILVSEIMLQQTQVDRVLPKYKNFLKRFPTVQDLAKAPLGDVLKEWQGLGYNRRAKFLHHCAQQIMTVHNGRFPKTQKDLMKLPGIGHYTAGAIMAFAYNIPVPIIETNIRTVIIHHFFNDATDISDQMILRLTERSLDTKNPREWYWAMMDYGAHLKKTIGNVNVRSKHYSKQSTFKDSDRQIRGAVIRLLTQSSHTRKAVHKALSFDIQRIDAQLERLTEEGMIVKKGQRYSLPV